MQVSKISEEASPDHCARCAGGKVLLLLYLSRKYSISQKGNKLGDYPRQANGPGASPTKTLSFEVFLTSPP